MDVKIFICYRREVSDDFARGIARRCKEKYGDAEVFYDRHSIQTAENWKTSSREFAAQADVFLLIIGPNWLTCSDYADARRIDDESDPVRHEIEAALGAKSIILPLLHGNAEMPRERDLPSTLAGLDAPNAYRITPDHYDRDVDMLFPKIDTLLQAAAAQRRDEEIEQREKLQRVAALAQRRAESFQQLLQEQGLASPPLSFWRRILTPYLAVPMVLFAALAFAAGWSTHLALQPGPEEYISKIRDLENKVTSLEREIATERKNSKQAQDKASQTIREARADRDEARSSAEAAETELAAAETTLRATEEAGAGEIAAAAKAKCDQVAMHPSDPRAGTKNSGVVFEKLNPANIAICESSLELDPDDPVQMFQLGRLLNSAKRDDDAVDWYAKAADQEYAFAQNNLGWMYENKRGVLNREANDPLRCSDDGDCDSKAVEWYAKAAHQDYAFAQNNLGWMYANRRGVLNREANDPLRCSDDGDCDSKAVDWHAKAADQENASARRLLGWMYANRRGVLNREANDPLGCDEGANDCDSKAVGWYAKAADQEDAGAQNNLGWMYANRRGVLNREANDPIGCDEDTNDCDSKAVEWYAKAAHQDYAIAQNNLGWMYANRRGVLNREANDPLRCSDDGDCDSKAVNWYAQAAAQGYAKAQENLGAMYVNKRGVLKRGADDPLGCADDFDCDLKAVDWFAKPVGSEMGSSEMRLGLMYEKRRGVLNRPAGDPLGCSGDACDDAALVWYNKSAALGSFFAGWAADGLRAERENARP